MKIIHLFVTLFMVCLSACASNDSTFQKDEFTTKSGKKVTIYAIKHGSLRIVYDQKEFEIDPVAAYAPKTDYTKLPQADFILITHEHFDHLDAEAVKTLQKRDTRIITNRNSASILKAKGNSSAIHVMSNFQTLNIAKDITLETVPAYNYSPDRLQFHPKGRDNGFILTLDGLRIYIAGDTEDIPEMAQIKNIDVAFMPCNLPYTMTVAQLARAARTVKPKVLFPYHYGKTQINLVKRELQGSGIDVRIRNYQ